MEIELNAYLEDNPGIKNGKYKRDLKTKYGEIKQFGFQFDRINKSKYIQNAISFSIAHPFQTLTLLKTFKSSGEYPGLMKISNGIEISNSNDLVVGTFSKPVSKT